MPDLPSCQFPGYGEGVYISCVSGPVTPEHGIFILEPETPDNFIVCILCKVEFIIIEACVYPVEKVWGKRNIYFPVVDVFLKKPFSGFSEQMKNGVSFFRLDFSDSDFIHIIRYHSILCVSLYHPL